MLLMEIGVDIGLRARSILVASLTRNTDLLWEFNEKFGIDRSAAVMNTLIHAL